MDRIRDELLRLQKEAIKLRKELKGFKSKEDYDRAKSKADEYFSVATIQLKGLAERGQDSLSFKIDLVPDPHYPTSHQDAKIFLHEMLIKEGISFVAGPSEYYFEVKDFGSDHSLSSLLSDSFIETLGQSEKEYIKWEAEYSKRLSEKSVRDIYIEISKESVENGLSTEKKYLLLDALSNAAYRNGFEGNIWIDGIGPRDEITTHHCTPTFGHYLRVNTFESERINNFIEIAHNDGVERLQEKTNSNSLPEEQPGMSK